MGFTTYSITEAAQELGIKPARVRYLIKHKIITYIAGRPNVIEQSGIDEYRARLEAIAKAKRGPEPGSPEALAAQRLADRRWLAMAVLKSRWSAENKRMKLAAQRSEKGD
jgi:hypothetical protein